MVGPQIHITLNEEGNINVEGAIDNKMLALGMLEVAKFAIVDYHNKANSERRIIPAAGMVMPPAGTLPFKKD